MDRAMIPRPEISDRARLVLIRMCNRAMDSAPDPYYFGGWGMLAHALAMEWDDDTGRINPTANKAVTRAVRELLDAKLISVKQAGYRGSNAEYWIHV